MACMDHPGFEVFKVYINDDNLFYGMVIWSKLLIVLILRPRCQVSIYRTISPLVFNLFVLDYPHDKLFNESVYFLNLCKI